FSYYVLQESFTNDDNLKICNGPVIYRIDIEQAIRNSSPNYQSSAMDIRRAFQRLSSPCNDKIIIKADIGSLEVTLSRDDLKYTTTTSDFIVERVLTVDALFMQQTIENIENKSDNIIRSIQKMHLMESDVSIYTPYVKLYRISLIDSLREHKKNIGISWDSKKEFIETKSKLIKCYYPFLAKSVAIGFQPFDYENVILNDDQKFYNENSKYVYSYFDSIKTNSKSIKVLDIFHKIRYLSLDIPREDGKPILDLSDITAFKIDFTKNLKKLFLSVTSVPQYYIDRCKQQELDQIEALKKERARKAAETRALNKLNKKPEKKDKESITTKYHHTYSMNDIINAKHIVFLSSAERNHYTPNFFKI
ncbi:MAG TPA: hypothetical protein PLP73_04750, partial [Candidatus Absconditabacterales bacterium]|nr:hypothetical protein [Candidatus Absconditabacterales bacterium]